MRRDTDEPRGQRYLTPINEKVITQESVLISSLAVLRMNYVNVLARSGFP